MNGRDERIVIVGAGFGGIAAAKMFARHAVRFTLIDRHNYHLFQPLLYQVATAVLSPADIATPIRAMLSSRRHRCGEVLMDELVSIDKAERIVATAGGARIPYSHLIVATGARFSYFGNEEKWRPHAHPLKSLDDALAIRRRVLLAFERAETAADPQLREPLMSFVVIGGGPTGVEMAGMLAELAKATLANDFVNIDPRAARVILIEASDTLLGGYPPHLGRYTRKKLEQLGVEIITGSPVEDVSADGVSLADRFIRSANLFWCAGVAATPVGEWLGVATERNGAVPVGRDLVLPGHPDIFVIGDAARVLDEDGKPLPALAPVAKQQGRYAAEAIIRKDRGAPPQDPFRYRDWGTMATIGRAAAVGTFGRLEMTGFIAWLFWGFVHIVYLTGFRSRVSVMVNWLWSWITYAKGARLITGPGDALVGHLDSEKAVKAELDRAVGEEQPGEDVDLKEPVR